MIEGRVTGEESLAGAPHARVETEFGEFLVPKGQVARVERETATAAATFVARQVVVVRYSEVVERQRKGSTDWVRVDWHRSPYGAVVNKPNELVRPGDRLRTGAGGWIELLLHRDVWVRVAESSEIEIPDAPEVGASLRLLRGASVHHVGGRPRGATFRVATASHVLGVRGTWFCATAGENESVAVREGEVTVDAAANLGAGEAADLVTGGPPTRREPSPSELERFADAPYTVPASRRVLIPGGTYVLSDAPGPTGEMAFSALHRGTTEVKVGDFYIDIDEVTREDYLAFYERFQGNVLPPVDVEYLSIVEPAERHATPQDRKAAQLARWRPQAPGDAPPRAPAVAMDWHSASAYARWRGGQLPTEAQWEVAARGRQGFLLPWGNSLDDRSRAELAEVAWRDPPLDSASRQHATGEGRQLRTPARTVDEPTLDVSPWGVRGMVTRATEFVRDWWVMSPFTLAAPGSGGKVDRAKVVRGCYGSPRVRFMASGTPMEITGFRCVVELE